jgi:hypothetical protein
MSQSNGLRTIAELKITVVMQHNELLYSFMKIVSFKIKETRGNCAENQGGNCVTGIQNNGAKGKEGSHRQVIYSV